MGFERGPADVGRPHNPLYLKTELLRIYIVNMKAVKNQETAVKSQYSKIYLIK